MPDGNRYAYGFRQDVLGTKLLLDSGDRPLFETDREAWDAGIEMLRSLSEETQGKVELVELTISPDGVPTVSRYYHPVLDAWVSEGLYVSADGRVIASSYASSKNIAKFEI